MQEQKQGMWAVFLRSDKDFPEEGTFFFKQGTHSRVVFFLFLFSFVFFFEKVFKNMGTSFYQSVPPPLREIVWGWRRAQKLSKELGKLRGLAGVHYMNLGMGGIAGVI